MATSIYQNIHRLPPSAVLEFLERLRPEGRHEDHEYVMLNPYRNDRNYGSFRINLNTQAWADFSSGEQGSDLVGLVAFLCNLKPYAAAHLVLKTLRVRL